MEMILITVAWLVVIVVSIVVIGEIRYRKECALRSIKMEKVCALGINKIESGFGSLKIEEATNEFTSTQKLALRGSWRVAQNNVWGRYTFEDMRDIEYSKKM